MAERCRTNHPWSSDKTKSEKTKLTGMEIWLRWERKNRRRRRTQE